MTRKYEKPERKFPARASVDAADHVLNGKFVGRTVACNLSPKGQAEATTLRNPQVVVGLKSSATPGKAVSLLAALLGAVSVPMPVRTR